MRRVPALLAACAVLVTPAATLGVTVDEVAQELRCPTCNTPLNVSDSAVAQSMKQVIREDIARGWSKDRIIRSMVVQFGRDVLATPPKSGFDLVAWLVPAAGVAAGLASIPVLMIAWRRRRGEAPVPELSEDDARRIDEALANRPQG